MKNGTSEYIPTSKPNCYTLKEGTSIIPKIPIEIKDKVEEIILPSSAKRIVDKAFSSCPNLKKITINEGLTDIGVSAFEGCEKLLSIKLPNSLNSLGAKAFYGCISLREIVIPNGISELCKETFGNCASLESIVLPGTLTDIGENAFSNCPALKKIIIPASIEKLIRDKIDSEYVGGAFQIETFEDYYPNTSYYEEWIYPEIRITLDTRKTNKDVGHRKPFDPMNFYYYSRYALTGCHQLVRAKINDGVYSINPCTFSECEYLVKIIIPDSVTEIGNNAFSFCKRLKSIILPNSLTSIGNQAFFGCESLETIIIPPRVTEIPFQAFAGCKNLKRVVLPAGLKKIDATAFEGCVSLREIIIPEGVEEIDFTAFAKCPNLKKLHLPSTLKRIKHSPDEFNMYQANPPLCRQVYLHCNEELNLSQLNTYNKYDKRFFDTEITIIYKNFSELSNYINKDQNNEFLRFFAEYNEKKDFPKIRLVGPALTPSQKLSVYQSIKNMRIFSFHTEELLEKEIKPVIPPYTCDADINESIYKINSRIAKIDLSGKTINRVARMIEEILEKHRYLSYQVLFANTNFTTSPDAKATRLKEIVLNDFKKIDRKLNIIEDDYRQYREIKEYLNIWIHSNEEELKTDQPLDLGIKRFVEMLNYLCVQSKASAREEFDAAVQMVLEQIEKDLVLAYKIDQDNNAISQDYKKLLLTKIGSIYNKYLPEYKEMKNLNELKASLISDTEKELGESVTIDDFLSEVRYYINSFKEKGIKKEYSKKFAEIIRKYIRQIDSLNHRFSPINDGTYSKMETELRLDLQQIIFTSYADRMNSYLKIEQPRDTIPERKKKLLDELNLCLQEINSKRQNENQTVQETPFLSTARVVEDICSYNKILPEDRAELKNDLNETLHLCISLVEEVSTPEELETAKKLCAHYLAEIEGWAKQLQFEIELYDKEIPGVLTGVHL